MIARHNLRQSLLAVLSLCIGLCAFAAAWWFFKFATAFSIQRLGGNVSAPLLSLIAWTCVALIALAGFLRWRNGGGYHRFDESGLMITAEPRTGVSLDVHETAERIGAWTYVLGQIFLAGPLRVLRAFEHWKSRIPNSPVLENELIALHGQLRAKNKWLPVSEFAGREQHIVYLARLDLIDWSPRKGTLRAR